MFSYVLSQPIVLPRILSTWAVAAPLALVMMIVPHLKAYALALPFTAAAAGESLYRLQRCRSVPGAAAAVLDEGAYVDASGDVAVSQSEELEWTMRQQETFEWQQLLAASSLGDACAAVWGFAANMCPFPPFTTLTLCIILCQQLHALRNACLQFLLPPCWRFRSRG
jgi:hypothetical protein